MSEPAAPELTPKKHVLSRQDFLKGLAAVVSVAVGTAIGLNNFVEKTAIDKKIRIFDEIASLPPTPKNKGLLRSYIKLSAAEIYAAQKCWVLTQEALNRFTSGIDEPWNISQGLIESLKISEGKDKPKAVLIRQLAQHSIQNIFTMRSMDPDSISASVSKKRIFKKLNQNKRFNLEVAAGSRGINDDMTYSLNLFRLEFKAEVAKDLTSPGEVDIPITLSNTTIKIEDVYDWNKDQLFASLTMDSYDLILHALELMGIKNPSEFMFQHGGVDLASRLPEGDLLQISVKDGYDLQAAGYCRPFPIYTDEIAIPGSLNIALPETYFS